MSVLMHAFEEKQKEIKTQTAGGRRYMATHIVMWNLKPELTEEQKKEAAAMVKEKLEALTGRVPGLIRAEVMINETEASTRDLALFCEFEKAEDIPAYQIHPAHVEAAGYVRTVTCDRVCFDY